MPIKTKRWNDERDPDDGFRLLITRYRPRGVSKSAETWDAWNPHLGPSRELLANFKTHDASPIGWPQYRRRYIIEQRANKEVIVELARREIGRDDHATLLVVLRARDAVSSLGVERVDRG